MASEGVRRRDSAVAAIVAEHRDDDEDEDGADDDMINALTNHGDFHIMECEAVYKFLNTSPDGMSEASIAEWKTANPGKVNELTPPPTTAWYWKFFEHLTGLFSLLLWAAGFMCFIAYALDPVQVEYMYLGVVLVAVVFMTGVFSYKQDSAASKQMASLMSEDMEQQEVKRVGKADYDFVDAKDIVPGDIVRVQGGKKIPADVRIFGQKCEVDNSSLTGENLPQKRNKDIVVWDGQGDKPNVLEATNLAFFGTNAQSNLEGIVIFIGDDTVMGKIATLMRETKTVMTPIAIEIEHFIQVITTVAMFLGITFVIIGFVQGAGIVENMVFGIGIIVANVPEGLLATVTISLTQTARNMNARNVIVKKLESVETLGSTTVIASDKTGTLTQNRMTIMQVWYNGESKSCYGKENLANPTSPALQRLAHCLALQGKTVFKTDKENMGKDPTKRETKGGNPTEGACFKYAEELMHNNKQFYSDRFAGLNEQDGDGGYVVQFRLKYPVNDKIPQLEFSSKNKYAASIHDFSKGVQQYKHGCEKGFRLMLKGAPERVLGLCSTYLADSDSKGVVEKKIDAAILDTLATDQRAFQVEGLRVLGCAYIDYSAAELDDIKAAIGEDTEFGSQEFQADGAEIPNNDPTAIHRLRGRLCFLGLVAIQDPPRHDVTKAVSQCVTAGIQVIMVTGDHADTAEAIARQIGIIKPHSKTRRSLANQAGWTAKEIAKTGGIQNPKDHPGCKNGDLYAHINAQVVTGQELSHLSKEQLIAVCQYKEVVFARTSPAQKLQIVTALQDMTKDTGGNKIKHVVAVTGDGVNDAPAIKKADIGIAMNSGSDVAKDSADMVLKDDSFSSIVAGVEEGRLIFDNLKKSIAYTLSSNIPEISPFLVFILFQIPLPLPTVLILCIDLGTDMLPAISLAYENKEANIMQKLPRDSRTDRLVTGKLVCFSYLQVGVVQALAGFFCYFVVLNDYGFDISILPFLSAGFLAENMRPVNCFNTNDCTHLEYNGENLPIKPCNIENENCQHPEKALNHAQCAFFISIIVVQWADLVACKTRELSLFQQSMRNGWLNFGLIWETCLGLVLCYIPFLNTALGTAPLVFHHWLPALPFCVFILAYDEIRKYLLRDSGPLGKDNWVRRNTYY
jgi:sodium/potassium-transporting ATPase subunit alpha